MGIADRHIEYRDNYNSRRFTLGQPGNALIALVSINIVVFLLILITRVFYLYTHQGMGMQELNFDAIEWFALPGQLPKFVERPWTLLTFMFSHGGLPAFSLLLLMLSNMLWLYAFGYILQELSGNKLIFPVYIYGSLAGALFYLVAIYAIPALQVFREQSFLTGASPGCTALAIAVTTLAPNYRIFKNIGKGIPVWVLTVLFLVFNFIGAVGLNNPGSFSIIGAALGGFVFMFFFKQGKDASSWMNNFYHWFINLFNPDKNKDQQAVKEKVFYKTGGRAPYNKTTLITQQRIDDILDKINQQGFNFLTEEEKNILKRASED